MQQTKNLFNKSFQYMSDLNPSKVDSRIAINALHILSPESICSWALKVNESLATQAVVMAPFERPTGWPENLRFQPLPEDELLAPEGQCLCCALKSPLADLLRRLFMAVLTKKESSVALVFVATYSKTPDCLVQTLKHAPFLAQRYRFGGYLCTDATNKTV
jgi:hypothetical protein